MKPLIKMMGADKTAVPKLYDRYFVQKGDERRNLFQSIAEKFDIKKGLYPGSFVHITPSFFIPEMVYADMDKRCGAFFRSPEVGQFVRTCKTYAGEPVYRFQKADFTQGIDEPEGYFDLLISFYSGFISKYCKQYLKAGGLLLTNNSHGDASLAAVDPGLRLVAAVKRQGNSFRIDDSNLHTYFRKKDGSPIDTAKVFEKMRGEGFTKPAYAYLFEKPE